MYYETVIIVNPDVSQENTQALTDSLIERVEKAAGRIVKREYWGSRPLSYQIAKRKRGHYTLLVTDGEPAAVQALEHALRLEERVLRFLTTRLTELSEEPSPLMRRRVEPAKPETEAPAETSAETKPAEKTEAAEAPKETKPAKAASEDKAEDVKAEEKPAEAEAEKAPAKKAATKKAEAEDAPAEKKKVTKAKKADGDADD